MHLSLRSSRSLAFALSLAAATLPLIACTSAPSDVASQSNELRSVTTEEALADFDQLASSFRAVYGALERKEARYGFRFDSLVAEYRGRVAQATKDSEFQGIFVEFVSRFKDAHISLSPQFIGDNALISDDSHGVRLPLSAMPIENTFVIYDVQQDAGDQVKAGDELLSIDGVDAETLVQGFLKYAGTPNPLAARHFAAARLTGRSAYLSASLHDGSTSTLRVRGADGVERTAVLPWKEIPHAIAPVVAAPPIGKSSPQTLMARSVITEEVTRAELTKFGAKVPFFMTDAVSSALGFQPVAPSAAALAKFNVTPEAAEKAAYFAGTYQLDGKKVLFLRLPSYMPDDDAAAFGWIQALVDEQQPNVDALLVDQTHNVGGSLYFALEVSSVLSPRPFNAFVQKNHADRMWITNYLNIADKIRPQSAEAADMILGEARKIDEAYTARRSHTDPMGMFGMPGVVPSNDVHWTKPSLMLVDELAVSCGDIVPATMKANAIMPLFGHTTMGGGGNVEEVATLTNTRWTLNLSRGLGTIFNPTGAYPDARFIEDNGVTPDIAYDHTLADYRAGYIGYVRAFNAALAQQLAPTK